ncbi:MAG: hypothetical protein AB7N54_18675 [Alphaproteobacteria bacterium]
MDELTPPEIVAHADWSIRPVGRRIAIARRRNDTWTVAPAIEAGDVDDLAARLLAEARGGTVLLGVDFPIGLPAAYAARAGIDRFLDWLASAGTGRWRQFYDPATTAAEIALGRPFYPARPGGTRRHHLVDALGVDAFAALHRYCDLGEGRAAAAPLFWTMGGNQVGKAAICGWRDLIAPARRRWPRQIHIWPFDGPLAALLARPGLIVAETYPGEIYHHLDLGIRDRRRSKRRQADRAADAPRLRAVARGLSLRLSAEAAAAIDDGYGPRKEGEDSFDATVGLLGMLNILRGNRPEGAPDHPLIRTVEGWILGQRPSGAVIEIASPKP